MFGVLLFKALTSIALTIVPPHLDKTFHQIQMFIFAAHRANSCSLGAFRLGFRFGSWRDSLHGRIDRHAFMR